MFFDVYAELCKSQGMTPNGVAKILGFASSSVTQWKNGSTPRPAALQKIADYFGVSVSYFLNGQKENPTASGEVNYSDMELLSAFNSADEATKQAIRLILGLK